MARAVTIGNFDGVHIGHQALLERAAGCGSVEVVTFDPHPITVLRGVPVEALTSIESRRRLLVEAGAASVRIMDPGDGVLEQSATEFLAWLADAMAPTHIVEGPDFRFGAGRQGSIETLQQAGERYGWSVIVVDPVDVMLHDRHVVRASSSRVRHLLGVGRVDDAARILGRPFALDGTVKPGAKKGRELGIPTANLATEGLLIPADGIYGGTANGPDGRSYSAAISIGTRPTFDGADRTVEVHLLDCDAPLDSYGWAMTVHIERWLRSQVRYDTIEPLVAQIHRDIDRVRRELV